MSILARFVGGVLDGQVRDLPMGRRLIVPVVQVYERRTREGWVPPEGVDSQSDAFWADRYEYVLVETKPGP